MLTLRGGNVKMGRRQNQWILQIVLVLVPAVLFITVLLQKYTNPFRVDWQVLSKSLKVSGQKTSSNPTAGPCSAQNLCADDHLSFYIHSGAAYVVAPKICVQNTLLLGTVLNNAGPGINVVTISGTTGELLKTDHFDMYAGDVEPLIKFLQTMETGSVALMASFDDASTKLNDEARKLIADLGSSVVQTLGFRDNWVFVGGKGAGKSNFEKHIKNDHAVNKYENWPELLELQGCIPKNLK